VTVSSVADNSSGKRSDAVDESTGTPGKKHYPSVTRIRAIVALLTIENSKKIYEPNYIETFGLYLCEFISRATNGAARG